MLNDLRKVLEEEWSKDNCQYIEAIEDLIGFTEWASKPDHIYKQSWFVEVAEWNARYKEINENQPRSPPADTYVELYKLWTLGKVKAIEWWLWKDNLPLWPNVDDASSCILRNYEDFPGSCGACPNECKVMCRENRTFCTGPKCPYWDDCKDPVKKVWEVKKE
jgi:hypothetical protein